ncbi:DEAD/DEAH box helicase family protein [Virgibacillus halodenitrificans]|uniref:DEAD/DEAH box helicase n=1 Tax=Virgibacillus halodenitrificans TaxID=1482 RepID=UPI0024C066A7|nr:DEAD/DEAH box helicase family protein [Virgibacillus halodenitrificans]WHX24912.1 DEAD/DEAH box helicase family protein [Virgibacillus halodenitrificans]
MASYVWEHKSTLCDKLRKYQIKAIETSLSYIKSNSTKQALIKMPTGTGKTFVISVLALFIRGSNNVLIVSPSATVRDHIFREIKKNLWDKLELNLNHKKSIIKLFPSNIDSVNSGIDKKVLVTTIQALTQIKNDNPVAFNSLQSSINLILFDEGHKEPATTWSETIRTLEKKTILFTATPIRNDFNLFNIDEGYYYNYSLKQAFDEKIIRTTEFKRIDLHTENEEGIRNFIDKIIEIKDTFDHEYNYESRVILRFANFDELNFAIEYLINKEECAIAIHERFIDTKSNQHKFKDVPSKNDATYWLAQNKLVEGVDDSRFAILGIYSPFDNARSLIQQIGRTLRKDSNNGTIETSLVVINSKDTSQEDIWKTFINYEYNNSRSNKLPIINFKNYFKDTITNQPNYIYSSKKFLKKFELEDESIFEDILTRYKFPLKVNIFSNKEVESGNIEFEELLKEIIIQKELSNEFVINQYKKLDDKKSLVIYAKYSNSSILSNESFIEVKLGLFYCWSYNNYLFFYDTNNYVPAVILDSCEPISNRKLQTLFNENSEFTEVTLRNGFISHNNINRQVINSKDITGIAPNVTDKYNFCTTVTGNIQEEGNNRKRYIGFSNSRVSDNSGYVLFIEYLDWIEKIAKKVTIEDKEQIPFFKRYSPAVGIPESTVPILITFNLSNIKGFIVGKSGEKVIVEELNYKVENNKFELVVDGEKINVNVKFENNKYLITYEDKSIRYYFNEDFRTDEYNIKKYESLLSYLNRSQDFHIVTNDAKHIYYKKVFYKCEIESDDQRLDTIFKEYELVGDKKIQSEKGDLSVERTEWSEDSLFYLVSSLGQDLEEGNELKETFNEMDYLICTDLGTEVADFIGLDTKNKRVYFIHCKAKDATRSASVFQDICSQIIKNLDYAHPLSNRIPDKIEKWKQDWKLKKVKRKRVIKGDIESEDIWNKIKECQRDPLSTTFIWGLTAKMFSLEEYKEQKTKDLKQKPEIIQIDYLLMNTWAAVQSIGGKFKFFFDKKA